MSLYRAPWSAALRVMSAVMSAVIIGVALLLIISGDAATASVLPIAILICSTLFTIRGYGISSDAILVRRLFWSTRLPRHGLESATADPAATAGSWRTFANGGLFSFSGWFYSRRLGAYRAFITDHRKTVVLRFAKRTVVVSPDPPDQFVDEIFGGVGAA